MNITQEVRVLALYQKTAIEIQPGELKQVIKINCQGGDVDSQKLEKELDKAFSEFL